MTVSRRAAERADVASPMGQSLALLTITVLASALLRAPLFRWGSQRLVALRQRCRRLFRLSVLGLCGVLRGFAARRCEPPRQCQQAAALRLRLWCSRRRLRPPSVRRPRLLPGLLACLVGLFVMITPALAQEPFETASASALRGTTITVTASKPASPLAQSILNGPAAELVLQAASGTQVIGSSQTFAEGEAKSFAFTIPEGLLPGDYQLALRSRPTDQAAPASTVAIRVAGSSSNKLRVLNASGLLAPTITSVQPRVVFPDQHGYALTIEGSDFGVDKKDLLIQFTPQDDRRPDMPITVGPDRIVSLTADRIELKGLTDLVHGDQLVRVRLGTVSSEPFSITVARFGRTLPLLGASGVLLLAIGLLLRILRGLRGDKGSHQGALTVLKDALIDEETRTYSLSRLQFYLWTAVAIWSYCYLLLSLVFAQGVTRFVDVPEGLPGIVLISASTSVFAAGITSVKGSKGSGKLQPCFSDLVTAGGNIVPERIQFLCWTLVGICVYLLLVVEQSPAEIKTLPTIPDGFLQLTGISSLGYLGGKLARKPGPVISGMEPARFDDANKKLTLVINGQNLSKNANYRIKLPDSIRRNPYLLPGAGQANPEVMIKEAQDGQADYGRILELSFVADDFPWTKAKALFSCDFTIFNPDGQFADWTFTAGAPGAPAPAEPVLQPDAQGSAPA